MTYLGAYMLGLMFATGLMLAGMTVPAKVMGFLDFTGAWDPTLAFVMGGAIGVYAPLYRWITKRRDQPLFGELFRLPQRQDIEWRLLGGAALFGVGWGMAGVCPGPALTVLGTGAPKVMLFVVSMVAGSWAYGRWSQSRALSEVSSGPVQEV